MDDPLHTPAELRRPYGHGHGHGHGHGTDHDDPSLETTTSEGSESDGGGSKLFKNVTIEPLMFLHMVGMAGSSVVVQNMYLDRVCRISCGFNETICHDLEKFGDAEKTVEASAAIYTTFRGLIEAGFPILFSLFLGPWTDVHGTKYPILLPLLGYFLSALTYLIFTFAPDLPPGFLLFAYIPVAASGGMVALILSVFSFMSKITSVENRSFRVAMLEASWFLGGPVGLVAGGYIYKLSDFNVVFLSCAVLYTLGFIYGVIVIKEDMPIRAEDELRHCCADMFNVAAVKEIFAVVVIPRPGKCRKWMHIMLITICLRIFVMMGYLNTMYLYTRNKFQWNLTNYTEYSVADSFIAITGSYIMIMITMKMFKLNDAIIGIIGSVGSVVGALVFAFASAGWMIYLGAVLSMFAGLISIVIRSMLSKIVGKEEVAKVFTFLACGEASMPLIAVPLYNLVFVSTNSVFPGAVFLITTSFYVIILLSFIYLYISMRDFSSLEQFMGHEDSQRIINNETEAEA